MQSTDEIADELFEATVIQPEQARKAYSLIRQAYPGVAFEQWLAFTRRWAGLPCHCGGILAVQDGGGYVHAIFLYRVDSHLQHRTLRISDLIVGRLPGGVMDRAVLRQAERLASELGCSTLVFEPLHSRAGNMDSANLRALEKAGYAAGSIFYLRRGDDPAA